MPFLLIGTFLVVDFENHLCPFFPSEREHIHLASLEAFWHLLVVPFVLYCLIVCCCFWGEASCCFPFERDCSILFRRMAANHWRSLIIGYFGGFLMGHVQQWSCTIEFHGQVSDVSFCKCTHFYLHFFCIFPSILLTPNKNPAPFFFLFIAIRLAGCCQYLLFVALDRQPSLIRGWCSFHSQEVDLSFLLTEHCS